MMYLTAGVFLKKIDWKKAVIILLYCTLFNLIGALVAGWAFANSSAFSHLTHDSFISGVVEMKLGRSNELILLEAISMFVFLSNEHIAANFASFSIMKFSMIADQVAHFDLPNILRHWGVTFIANFIGGGLLIGLPYAFLNKNEDTYVD